jgi:hypothetical protein
VIMYARTMHVPIINEKKTGEKGKGPETHGAVTSAPLPVGVFNSKSHMTMSSLKDQGRIKPQRRKASGAPTTGQRALSSPLVLET